MKERCGNYRVLCFRDGVRVLLLLWTSHFSKRLLKAWPVLHEEVCAISVVPSALPNSNSLNRLRVNSPTFCMCSKNLRLRRWKFSTHRRYHRCAQARYSISFASWCKKCTCHDCKLHDPGDFQRSVQGSMGPRLSPRCFCDYVCVTI